jgi:hypothetical protein
MYQPHKFAVDVGIAVGFLLSICNLQTAVDATWDYFAPPIHTKLAISWLIGLCSVLFFIVVTSMRQRGETDHSNAVRHKSSTSSSSSSVRVWGVSSCV